MPTLDEMDRLERAATKGPWRVEPHGGSSTVLANTEPPRNDTRIPAYAYAEHRGYCLAYPFLSDKEGGGYDVRLDFVCFSHDDARLIVALRNSAPALLACARALEAIRNFKPVRGGGSPHAQLATFAQIAAAQALADLGVGDVG